MSVHCGLLFEPGCRPKRGTPQKLVLARKHYNASIWIWIWATSTSTILDNHCPCRNSRLFFWVRMFGVYHGISYFSDTPPVRYKNSSESQSQCRGAIPRASFENPSAGREKFCRFMTQMMKSSKTCQFLGIHLVKPTWKTQVFCRFNSENYLPDPFYFWGSKLLNGNGCTSRPRLGLFWYSSSKYWGCPILPRTQMIKCLISTRYLYLSPNTYRLPLPLLPYRAATTRH